MRLISELWKDVYMYRGTNYEGKYRISSKGRAQNTKRGNFLNPYSNKTHPYPCVTFTKGKDSHKTIKLHRIVAEMFLINPNGYKHINHKDENPGNFDINNLEWCTQQYNNNYGSHGEKIAKTLGVPIVQLDPCGNLIKIWNSTKEAGRDEFNNGDICECINKHKKSHRGYIWLKQSEYNEMTREEVAEYCSQRDKRIAQIDENWNLVYVYDSLRYIDQTKFCESMIYDVMRGKRELYKGYRWMKYSAYLLRNY